YLFLFVALFCHSSPAPEIYTLSLHDALPISLLRPAGPAGDAVARVAGTPRAAAHRGAPRRSRRHPSVRGRTSGSRRHGLRRARGDRKSTRLNSSHVKISYAVFCLKKKKKTQN